MAVKSFGKHPIILLILASSWTFGAAVDVSVDFGNADFVIVEAFNEIELNVTVTCLARYGGDLTFVSADESVFTVRDNTSMIECFPGDNVTNVTYSLYLDGVALGVADMRTVFQNSSGEYLIDTYLVKVLRKPLFTPTALAAVLLVWICVSYVTMGSKIEPKLMWEHIKRPRAVLIGLLCQFLIMPPLSFAIAKAFQLDDAAAIGLILDGTCPGGWFSNVFTLLLDCDFNLSLTMTFSSTVLALGMMPLNLFIYTRFFLDHNKQLQAPYGQLAIQLAFLVVPVVIGLGLSHKFPKVKRIFDKMLRPMLAGLVVVALGVGIPTQYYVVLVSWKIWIASAVFPLIGGMLGFGIARLTCVDLKPAVTIAIETGVQNSLLAITVVTLYYDQPEIDLIGRVPALIGLLVVMEGGTLAIVKSIRDFYKKRTEVPHVELDEETEDVDKERTVSSTTVDPYILQERGNQQLDNSHDVPKL
ncbi:ileal sodium/bile acid cotransporter [Strongylocentrotus purpuratus]|uniref:Ileal sodium/bile acid cotransporter n=1 Tax=Strongylocentrotus purpuratus TaxID=7668 RepID=A0A7M7HNH0_STRPU|nr:ileal sodium/bile acid cotransporter [Strongylocentrotus purpuratus]XP_011683776.2 ileal sodium/bile acid cotransporter [Strongylocentrotus purpuratus]